VSDRAGYLLISILVTSVFGGLVYSAGNEPQTQVYYHAGYIPAGTEQNKININPKVTYMTTVSTELINYSGFTSANIAAWTALCTAQGITEVTLRLPAYSDFLDGSLSYTWRDQSLAIIASLKAAGIDTNIDCHTWYTTWDTYFRDSATNSATYRNTYKTWLTEVINSFDGVSGVKAFMVLNEPQGRAASASENTFIIELINLAQSLTSLPVSVRFMAGYSPSTGHYSSAIDLETDFLARNTYWDPRYPTTSVYGTTEAKMNTDIALATTLGKELWITEFGKVKTNVSAQKDYIEAFVAYAKIKEIDRIFAWASAPTDTSESYNLFNGWTPYPAWYTLDSSAASTDDTNYAPAWTGWDLTIHDTEPYIVSEDATVLGPSGANSIKVEPHVEGVDDNTAREVNSLWIPARPGDHLIFRVYAKTGALENTDHTTGARAGIDFYCATVPSDETGVVDGQPHGYKYDTDGSHVGVGEWYSDGDASYVDGAWDYTNYQTFVDTIISDFLLPWGNGDAWHLLEWDVVVPLKTYTQNYEAVAITPQQICGVILWLDCRNVADAANAWFADPVLYINPTDDPPDTVTITASSDAHCVLDSEGAVSVAYGGSKTFTWTLDEGYIINGIAVDSAAVGNTGSYTFSNVVANHTIAITSVLGSAPSVNIKAISQTLRRLNGE
jgi:hypothetical protein